MVAQASKGTVINCSCANLRATSGLASLRCRSSDSLGEFRFDESAVHVKLLEDEVQHAFLGRRLRVWQEVPPERHLFPVGGNDFSDAWVLHGVLFTSSKGLSVPGVSPRRVASRLNLGGPATNSTGRVRTFPRFTVPYFQPLPPHFSHFAVSSFFDQCTGGEILVNCRWSECESMFTAGSGCRA